MGRFGQEQIQSGKLPVAKFPETKGDRGSAHSLVQGEAGSANSGQPAGQKKSTPTDIPMQGETTPRNLFG